MTRGLYPQQRAKVAIAVHNGGAVDLTEVVLAIDLPPGVVVDAFKDRGAKRYTKAFAKHGKPSATPGGTYRNAAKNVFYWYNGYIPAGRRRKFQLIFHYDGSCRPVQPRIALRFRTWLLVEGGIRRCASVRATNVTYPLLAPLNKKNVPTPAPVTCAPTPAPTPAPGTSDVVDETVDGLSPYPTEDGEWSSVGTTNSAVNTVISPPHQQRHSGRHRHPPSLPGQPV